MVGVRSYRARPRRVARSVDRLRSAPAPIERPSRRNGSNREGRTRSPRRVVPALPGEPGSSSPPGSGRPRGVRLGRPFFDRPTRAVARELLGTVLAVRDASGRWRSVRLVETEAYVRGDPANHAYRGRTSRNASMFSAPGTLYVFRIHQVVCANLVTRPGEAVLLRAGEPRSTKSTGAAGPGRLAAALGITIADDGTDGVTGARIRLVEGRTHSERIVAAPRVGIRRAVGLPLRFAFEENPWVSRPRPIGATSASPSGSCGGARCRRTRTTSRRPSGGGRSGGRSVGR